MKKLALLLVVLGATAAGLLTAPRAAEAACKKICCPDGTCIICCAAPCPTIVCPP